MLVAFEADKEEIRACCEIFVDWMDTDHGIDFVIGPL